MGSLKNAYTGLPDQYPGFYTNKDIAPEPAVQMTIPL